MKRTTTICHLCKRGKFVSQASFSFFGWRWVLKFCDGDWLLVRRGCSRQAGRGGGEVVGEVVAGLPEQMTKLATLVKVAERED